jgi:hypothetical protein
VKSSSINPFSKYGITPTIPSILNDFVRYEQVSGDVTAPKIGDIANHTYDQNGKEFTMKETIVAYNPPNHIKLFMTSGWFDMEIVNDLEAVSDNQTKLIAAADTVRTSLIMKIMMLFMSKTKMQKDHEMQINKLKELIEAN